MIPDSPNQFLSTTDLAARWNVSRSHIINLYNAGALKGFAIGKGLRRRTLRFPLSVVEAWEQGAGFQRSEKRPEE